jgi:acyl-CoA dehydrogenase
MKLLDLLLASDSKGPECPGFDGWLPLWTAVQEKHADCSPFVAGAASALQADRLAWAFFSGYQAAIRSAFPGALPAATVAAFCVQEPGRKISEITTTLDEHAGGLLLQGHKGWLLADPQDFVLFVLARRAGHSKGPGSLAVVSIPFQSDGISRGPVRAQAMVPELAHAEVRFDAVSLLATRVLPGDGYADYAKPFRVLEDIHVTGCALAYLFAEGRAAAWPAPWAQRCVAAIAGLESCSRLDPGDARTHIVTAGTLSFAGAVIRESEQHWRDDQGRARDRWQRDNSILALGKEARRQRAIQSWTVMGRGAEESRPVA